MYTSILIDNIKFSDYAPFCDEVNVSAIFYRKFCDINAEVKCKICCIMNAPILNIPCTFLGKGFNTICISAIENSRVLLTLGLLRCKFTSYMYGIKPF